MLNLVYLLLFLLLLLVLWQGLAAREIVLSHIKKHCGALQLQLLEESVVLKRLGYSLAGLKRVYTFEFSSTGYERYQGEAQIVRGQVIAVELQPYRLPEQDSESDYK